MNIFKAIKAKIISFYRWMLQTSVNVETQHAMAPTKANWIKMKATELMFAFMNAAPLIVVALLARNAMLALGFATTISTTIACLAIAVVAVGMGYFVYEACMSLQDEDMTVSI